MTLPGTGGTVSFKYDPFGRRIYKSSLSGTRIYAYDRDNVTEETNASGTLIARYTQGVSIDEPLARSDTALNFYNADGLGSITSLTDTNAGTASTYSYGAFGSLSSSNGTIANPYRYTAREFDQETGLYYYRARYYDPFTGRFIGEDPVDFEGGNDFYAYVANNPTNYVDSDGLGKRRPRHLPGSPSISCDPLNDTCKQIYWKIWAFNWLINSHIGFDLRPNYTGKPHTEEIQSYWNGLQNCVRIAKKKRCNGPNDPKPECQMASQPDPKAVEQLQNLVTMFGVIGAGGAVATQPELWWVIPVLERARLAVAH